MRDRVLLITPGLALCALMLVASVAHSAPRGLVRGVGISLVLACGAAVILTQVDADRDGHSGESEQS